MLCFIGLLLSLIWSRCAARRWPPKALGGLGHRRAQTNMQVVAPFPDVWHRVRHRGSRGRGACACVVLVVYAKVRGERPHT